MDIGKKIKELRILKGLTQEELADRAELTKGFISQVERNHTSPSIATLVDILQCLGTDLKNFFEEDEDNDLAIIEEDDDYNTDDVNIENLLKSALYSILTVILFVINLRIIKINDIKTLIINNGISILCSFVAILMIWNNYNFDVNITIIWLIYPLYLP